MFSTKSRTLVASLILTLGAACAGPAALTGKENAEAAYNKAVGNLKNGEYPDALAAFADVKAKFPYSKYAALADLRLADTHFEQGKFLEAVDAYRQFIKMHPTHQEIPYALWRIAESDFKQAPDAWWFLPPPEERDQSTVRLAISAYQDVIDRYPQSEYAPQARAKIDDCHRLLAEHELYVAKFYWKHEKWQAAAARAEGLAKDYPNLGFDAEALLLAVRARTNAGDAELARNAGQRLVAKFPQSAEAAEAQNLMRKLPAQPSPTAPVGG